MSQIDPTNLERGTNLKVTDKDSHYYGTEGKVVAIFEDRVTLQLSSDPGAWTLTLQFDLDELDRV